MKRARTRFIRDWNIFVCSILFRSRVCVYACRHRSTSSSSSHLTISLRLHSHLIFYYIFVISFHLSSVSFLFFYFSGVKRSIKCQKMYEMCVHDIKSASNATSDGVRARETRKKIKINKRMNRHDRLIRNEYPQWIAFKQSETKRKICFSHTLGKVLSSSTFQNGQAKIKEKNEMKKTIGARSHASSQRRSPNVSKQRSASCTVFTPHTKIKSRPSDRRTDEVE